MTVLSNIKSTKVLIQQSRLQLCIKVGEKRDTAFICIWIRIMILEAYLLTGRSCCKRKL